MATIDDTATMNLKAPCPTLVGRTYQERCRGCSTRGKKVLEDDLFLFQREWPHCQFCVSGNILSFSVALRQETRISVLSYTYFS